MTDKNDVLKQKARELGLQKLREHPSFRDKFSVSPDGCWLWLRYCYKGYGYTALKRKTFRAHRLSFFVVFGRFPRSTPDHLCRNRACINPFHLEEVTSKTNVLRGVGPTAVNSRKEACNNGHSLSGSNLYLYTNKKGEKQRICRECRRRNNRKWREAFGRKEEKK